MKHTKILYSFNFHTGSYNLMIKQMLYVNAEKIVIKFPYYCSFQWRLTIAGIMIVFPVPLNHNSLFTSPSTHMTFQTDEKITKFLKGSSNVPPISLATSNTNSLKWNLQQFEYLSGQRLERHIHPFALAMNK